MLYQLLGQEVAFEGPKWISVKRGTSGCVLHGPYEVLDPGRYFVIFNIATDGQNNDDQERVCPIIDVVLDRARYVSKDIRGSRLVSGPVTEALSFAVEKRTTAEYRVFASGVTSLMIDTTRRVVQIPTDAGDLTPFIEADLFPTAAQAPEFFRSNMPKLRALYDRGARIKFIDSNVVIQLDGVSLHARSMDDIWFIDEIFFKLTYNVISGRPCCVIDVGMNIGLTTLFLANKPNVKEIHSFEPFVPTYERALSNIALNPHLAGKIHPNNFGLSDRDEVRTVQIANERISGAFSIWGSAHGTPHEISIQDAATVLRPTLLSAAAKGLKIVGKIDCGGAEFSVFESLCRDGLLEYFDALMVEWHRSIPSKDQIDLLKPLLERNFIAFDTSGKVGNGFFYAVRNL
jgi:FkbM family methyltransferase